MSNQFSGKHADMFGPNIKSQTIQTKLTAAGTPAAGYCAGASQTALPFRGFKALAPTTVKRCTIHNNHYAGLGAAALTIYVYNVTQSTTLCSKAYTDATTLLADTSIDMGTISNAALAANDVLEVRVTTAGGVSCPLLEVQIDHLIIDA